MAHFAKLDENNVVLEIQVIHNNELLDDNGQEDEQKGVEFLSSLYGGYNKWKQTSYNGNFRKNYAGPGYSYDSVRDAFISPKPFNSWTLNETFCIWESPSPKPDDGKSYYWDEESLQWLESNLEM